jgi:hypothetical protein
VPLAKSSGLTQAQYVAGFELTGMDAAHRDQFARHIALLWDRDPADAAKNHSQDLAFFLRCAVPEPPAAAPPRG